MESKLCGDVQFSLVLFPWLIPTDRLQECRGLRASAFYSGPPEHLEGVSMKKSITDKGFTCECGVFYEFGMWVAAHWNEQLTHFCPVCHARHSLKRGVITLEVAGKNVKAIR